jgi:3-oxoacyl-[acyl-carrier-protein] synthase III
VPDVLTADAAGAGAGAAGADASAPTDGAATAGVGAVPAPARAAGPAAAPSGAAAPAGAPATVAGAAATPGAAAPAGAADTARATATATTTGAIVGSLRGAAVIGVGAALPDGVVRTSAIAERLGVTERWIESRTGVVERRRAAGGERLSDLAARAGLDALARAGVAADSLDLVIVATSTADEAVPAAAPLVAGAIGAVRAGAFDVDAACNGFLSALNVAASFVEAGRAGVVLVIGADVMSRLVDPDDRRTAPLFGDGAGAVVVGACAGASRIGPTVMRSDASGAGFILAPGGPASLVMDGHETFKAAVARLSEVTLDALRVAGLALRDVDLFVYHQANARILVAVGERLGLPHHRVVNAIGRLGNTSAASIPLALDAASRDGSLVPGSRVLLAAFGAGFTWGATTVEWGAEPPASPLDDEPLAMATVPAGVSPPGANSPPMPAGVSPPGANSPPMPAGGSPIGENAAALGAGSTPMPASPAGAHHA